MSTLISLDSVSHRIGSKQLFEGLSLNIGAGARLGICGPNGSGKSTLLGILAGTIIPDDGRVVQRRDISVAYVPQKDTFHDSLSISETLLQRLEEQAIQSIPQKKFDRQEAEQKVQSLLLQVGFVDFSQPTAVLSGGWRKRLSIALALAVEPDVLFLDEPTNHLDLAGLLWLQDLLNNASFAWALVSHDRYFLEHTITQVLEIAPCFAGGAFFAKCGYSQFLERRENFLEQEEQRISSLANKVRNELEWASRSPKARSTKSGHRLREASRLEQELQERRSRLQVEECKVSFSKSDRETKELVKFINVAFGFGDQLLLRRENFTVFSRSCLGILGTNGQGKSTLLKLIGGALEPTTGKVKQADFLRVVYFDQLRHALDMNASLRYALGDGNDQVPYQGKFVHIIGWARRFGFHPDELDKLVSQLSGGEQARLLLAKLATQEADLLILDEPTNDLDIPMLEALELMLLEFEGASVLVTHDRYMLNKVCSHFLGFTQDQGLVPFAEYEQWEATLIKPTNRTPAEAAATLSTPKQTEEPKPIGAGKKSFQYKRSCDQIERKIQKAEKNLADIQVLSTDPAAHKDHQASALLAARLAAASAEVEELYREWEKILEAGE
jgi:ATP-binding cassette subfamily F protein uup